MFEVQVQVRGSSSIFKFEVQVRSSSSKFKFEVEVRHYGRNQLIRLCKRRIRDVEVVRRNPIQRRVVKDDLGGKKEKLRSGGAGPFVRRALSGLPRCPRCRSAS